VNILKIDARLEDLGSKIDFAFFSGYTYEKTDMAILKYNYGVINFYITYEIITVGKLSFVSCKF
jgi:hypothetical protein